MSVNNLEKRESQRPPEEGEQSPKGNSHSRSRSGDSQIAKNLTQGESQEEISITLVTNQGYLFIMNNDQIPFAQIAFVDDCYPNYNGVVGLENFLQQKDLQSVQWTNANDFIRKSYPAQEELELALTYIKQNMRDSRQLQTINAILNENVDHEWNEMVVENPLSMNLRGIEMIQEMLLEDLVFLALRLFLQQGFDQSFEGLSVFLKLQPLQLILAFVDCFPQYGDMVYSLILKQGIIQRNIPRSQSSKSQNQGTSVMNNGPTPSQDPDLLKADKLIGYNQYHQTSQANQQFLNPDQNFAQYIQSFIKFAQERREGENHENRIDLAQQRIQILREIVESLDCSLPLILKQLGVRERQSNNFLKKQFIQQIKNIRTCIRNNENECKVDENETTVDRIQSEIEPEDFSYEKSYQTFYADREDELFYQQQQQQYSVPQKINFEQHRLEAWNLLYEKISQGAPLTKHEEDQWRYFAFEVIQYLNL